MHIHVRYNPPPIPDRRMDWCATTDDYEPGHPIGWGSTRAAALEDLCEQLQDRKGATQAYFAAMRLLFEKA